ncbi:MAG TPA: DNA primase [Bacteroidetes bacterium]|nr:DNA primase [Bacteroidota bacterium]|tara:strand:+ start:12944 stop:14986 length:2043 start_codon:yes stop_codon:yes gene_type:complete
MRIPEHKLDEIRQAADIVEVVADVVSLKKSGQGFTGLCPFHNEKTPSFRVNPDMGIFKCFGCGEGGDAFSFVMKTEHVSFMEAVRSLAERYNVDLPEEDSTPEQAERATRFEKLYEALRFAANWYYQQLKHHEEAEKARVYLQKRGFTIETIRVFGLGYAPPSGQALLDAAVQEGIDESILLDTDLVKPSSKGEGVYDSFRDRLMFPILNPSARVIGFAGRTFDENKGPKYVNSAQTDVYNKSQVLYGIHLAKSVIRQEKQVILVEGYTDVMSLAQHGVKNVVANSGTALTREQLELLKRYSNRLLMIYDADAAGQKAMVRGIELALEMGLEPETLQLPEGEDPDSFVKEQGQEGFIEHKRKNTEDYITYLLRLAEESGRLTSMHERVHVIEELVELLAAIPDPVARQVATQQLHQSTHKFRGGSDRELHAAVDASVAKRQQRNKLRQTRTEDSGPRTVSGASQAEGPPPIQDEGLPLDPSAEISDSVTPSKRRPEYERRLLKLCLEHGAWMVDYIYQYVYPSFLEDSQYREFFELLVERAKRQEPIDRSTFRAFPSSTPELLATIFMEKHTPGSRMSERMKQNRFDQVDEVMEAKSTMKVLVTHYLQRLKASITTEMSEDKLPDTRRQELVTMMREAQKQLNTLQSTAAEHCFENPAGYDPEQKRKEGFSYTPKPRKSS